MERVLGAVIAFIGMCSSVSVSILVLAFFHCPLIDLVISELKRELIQLPVFFKSVFSVCEFQVPYGYQFHHPGGGETEHAALRIE